MLKKRIDGVHEFLCPSKRKMGAVGVDRSGSVVIVHLAEIEGIKQISVQVPRHTLGACKILAESAYDSSMFGNCVKSRLPVHEQARQRYEDAGPRSQQPAKDLVAPDDPNTVGCRIK